MTAPQPANAASSLATTIGRYFTVISVVPSLLLIALLIVLVRSGAWTAPPDFGAGVRALADQGIGGAFAIILGALALGAVLHPVQFALVQFLEGYWGTGPLWSGARADRIRFHVGRRTLLHGVKTDESGIVDTELEIRESDPSTISDPIPRVAGELIYPCLC